MKRAIIGFVLLVSAVAFGQVDASQVTKGTLPAGRLPAPTSTTLGGVKGTGGALTCGVGKIQDGFASDGSVHCQPKPVIDVSTDVSGVDCTGATDSSAALNTLWDTRLGGNINGKHVIIPPTCSIQAASPLIVFGQSFFVIDGGGREPQDGNGAVIFGCGSGNTGAVLQITRSGHAEVRGLSVEAKGLSCTSGFTGSILVNSDPSGGVTATDITFTNMDVNTNRGGALITNYIGIQIGATLTSQNTERMKIVDSSITCGSSSPGSIGIYTPSGNADHAEVRHNNIAQCKWGLYGKLGGTVQDNNMSNGSYLIFGSGGANFYVLGCSSNQLSLINNEMAEFAGQFYVQAVGAGCNNVLMSENMMNTNDVDPSVYAIDVGNGISKLTMINNTFTMISGNTMPTVGTSQSTTVLSNTNIVEIGNVSNTGLFQNATVAQGIVSLSGSPAVSSKSLLFTPVQPAGGTLGNPSPFLTFRTNQYVSSASTNYDFIMGAVTSRAAGNQTPTLVLDRLLPNNNLGVAALMTPLSGGLTTYPLTWGTNTVSASVIGTAGSTSYTYVVVAATSVGGAPSPSVATATGNAVLTSTNYNKLSWYPIPGPAEYCIYRSASGGTPSSTGLLGCVSASTLGSGMSGGYTFSDTGLTADGSTTPTTNTADGRISIAAQYITTVATGTPPLVVNSTTPVPNLSILGNAATASAAAAAAAAGTECGAGQAARGVDASWNAKDCFTPAGGAGTVTSSSNTTGRIPKFTNSTTPADIGNSTYSDIVNMFASGSCTGFLKSDGTCANPSGAGTVTNTAGVLTNNAVVQGAGGADTKVSPGITTNGGSELDLGVSGTNGVLGLVGSTSGKATFTAPGTAGTVTNPVVASNVQTGPTGSCATTPTWGWNGSSGYGLNFGQGTVICQANTAIAAFSSAANNGLRLTAGACFQWATSTNADSGVADTGICRPAAKIFTFGSNTSNDTTGKLKASAYMSLGTKFTTNGGCSETSLTGGGSAGSFLVGSTSCTTIVTLGDSATAPNGWSCWIHDETTSADYYNPHISGTTATTLTIVSGTVVSGDKIVWGCLGY